MRIIANISELKVTIGTNSKIVLWEQVGAQSSQMKMTPVSFNRKFSWEAYFENGGSFDSSFTTVGLLEQINTTRDVSDYLWYMTE